MKKSNVVVGLEIVAACAGLYIGWKVVSSVSAAAKAGGDLATAAGTAVKDAATAVVQAPYNAVNAAGAVITGNTDFNLGSAARDFQERVFHTGAYAPGVAMPPPKATSSNVTKQGAALSGAPATQSQVRDIDNMIAANEQEEIARDIELSTEEREDSRDSSLAAIFLPNANGTAFPMSGKPAIFYPKP